MESNGYDFVYLLCRGRLWITENIFDLVVAVFGSLEDEVALAGVAGKDGGADEFAVGFGSGS